MFFHIESETKHDLATARYFLAAANKCAYPVFVYHCSHDFKMAMLPKLYLFWFCYCERLCLMYNWLNNAIV